jgi:CBS domain-containing protein
MQLKQVMTTRVEDIAPQANLQQAAEKMKSLDVGALPVCDQDKLLGMITDRDIAVRAVAEGRDPKATRVSDAMSPGAIWCYDDDDVREAARIMEEKQIRRLLVLDRNKRAVGIVSLGDIATRLGDDQLSGEALQQVSQPSRPHA